MMCKRESNDRRHQQIRAASGWLTLLSVFLLSSSSQGAVGPKQTFRLQDSGMTVEVLGDGSYDVRHGGVEQRLQQRLQIRLQHGSFDPLDASARPQIAPELMASEGHGTDEPESYLVQFHTQAFADFQNEITRLGGRIFTPIPDQTLIVNMTPRARQRVEKLPFVRWIGLYHPAYKMPAELAQFEADRPAVRYSILLLDRDLTMRDKLAHFIAAVGGKVHLSSESGLIEASLDRSQLLLVAGRSEVSYIDLWGPQEPDMDVARDISGATHLETVEGYTGQGVRFEIRDDGILTTHQDFQANPPIFHPANNTDDDHGTPVSSICFGSRANNPEAGGILPNAEQPIFASVFSFSDRYQHLAELVDPGGAYRAVFQTNSFGSTRTTTYTTISADTDRRIFDHDLLVFQSQSNAGNRNSRPEAWAKNIVSVGALDHFNTLSRSDDSWSGGNASIGPADDGRVKPDLWHFYDLTRTASHTGNSNYQEFGGTSGATPITAAYSGLVFQMWADGVFAGGPGLGRDVFNSRPHASTAKALMIHSAFQYAFSGTGGDKARAHQGWGMADIQNLYETAEDHGWGLPILIDESAIITPLDTHSYSLDSNGTEPLKVTLVYADPPGTPAAAIDRINDLTLRVVSPSGTVYWGNNGLGTGNWSTSGGSPNTIDTVENVFVQNPQAGTWTIEVRADEVVQDGHVETGALDADYALVASGGSTGCTPQANANAGPDQSISEGSSVQIGTPAQAGHTYSWSPGGATSAQITVSPTSTTIYTVTATTSCGSAQDSVTVTVNPAGGCLHDVDFSAGAGGWTGNTGSCSTGDFIVGTPDATAWQLGSGNPGQAFFTQNNGGGIGTDDVDGGTCEALSPTVNAAGAAAVSVSLDYYHGQRDAGDDASDGFTIEVLNNGSVVNTLVSIGDVTNNPAWTNASTVVNNPGNVQVRVRASDAAGPGDIVEAGIDNVQICPVTQTPCVVDDDFESGTAGWVNDGASTCSTGAYVTGNPTQQVGGGVTTQVGGSNSGVTSIFTATNTSAGNADVDGGNCILASPSWSVTSASTLSVAYFHGQRDAGDDASGDFFLLEYSTNGGSSWNTLASNGDATQNAAWTTATTPIAAGSNVQLRVQCSDGAGPGDLVECGIDDVSICSN